MTAMPTPEEIFKVRRWECSYRGHDWLEYRQVGSEDPLWFGCGHCGKVAGSGDGDR